MAIAGNSEQQQYRRPGDSLPGPKATVVLGSGAPNSPLMSGVLGAVYEAGKTFNNFFSTGGGGLIGLSLVAPKLDDPFENVKAILNTAVADPIYERLPMNYKVFRKNSPLLEPMQKMFDAFKLPGSAERPRARLWNDMVDLGVTMMCPGGMPGKKKRSVCAPFAILPEIVDFDKLERFTGTYFLNAYNIDKGRIETFSSRQHQLDARHFQAALAFPFIYPPGEIDGQLYYEGADVDPVGLLELMKIMEHDRYEHMFEAGHTVIVIDILGSLEKAIVRNSRSLWDAYGISMLTPIVSCARWSKAAFRERHMLDKHGDDGLPVDHYRHGHRYGKPWEYRITTTPEDQSDEENHHTCIELRFDVPESQWPHLTDWSYTNLSKCWDIGYATGQRFIEQYGHLLPDREGNGVNVRGT